MFDAGAWHAGAGGGARGFLEVDSDEPYRLHAALLQLLEPPTCAANNVQHSPSRDPAVGETGTGARLDVDESHEMREGDYHGEVMACRVH